MNFFEYTLKIQELERAKYKKQFDTIMREMVTGLKAMESHGSWGNTFYARTNKDNFEETKLYYKVFAKAINNIKNMVGIADFISAVFNALEKNMSVYVAENGDYEMYLDVFEYSQDIKCDGNNLDRVVIPFISIIGDKEYPYKFKFDVYVSTGYRTLTFESKKTKHYNTKYLSDGADLSLLIELEDLRSKFDNSTRWTVLEELLDEVYNNPTTSSDPGNNSLKQTRESTRRILESIDRVVERTNGQLPVQTTAA